MSNEFDRSPSQSKCFAVDPSVVGQRLQRPSAHHQMRNFGTNFSNRTFIVAQTAVNASNNSFCLNIASYRPLDIPVFA